MPVQPSCNARFHVTWFNIDSLPHANRTTLQHREVALHAGWKISLKANVKHLMCIFFCILKNFFYKYKSSHLFHNTVYFYKRNK